MFARWSTRDEGRLEAFHQHLAYLDQAYMDARMHGWVSKPSIEMHIPSVLDDSLTLDQLYSARPALGYGD